MSTQMSQAIEEYDRIAGDGNVGRDKIIQLLEAQFDHLQLDPTNESAMKTQAKLMLLKTASDLYKDKEATSLAKIKVLMSNDDTKANKEIGALAAEVLRRISMNDTGTTPNAKFVDDDKLLEARCTEAGITVMPEESTEANETTSELLQKETREKQIVFNDEDAEE